MDTGFIDLDILLMKVRNPQSKVYFLDAVKAYKAGALRASMTSAWVALVFDLILKYRELSAMGDLAAAAFIQSWDNATASNGTKKLLELEASIIDDATNNTQVINHIANKHLKRLREDRNFCAHPAFSAEAVLFEPSPELVRLHLVNVVDLVLSQEPLQGKAIFELYGDDVQSPGFPTAHQRILDYVEQRYLKHVRPQNIRNFGTVLAKSLLKGEPAAWDSQHRKIISSLVAVRDRAQDAWADVSLSIVRLIDNLDPPNRGRAIAFIATFPDFWPRLQESTKTALQQTVDSADPATQMDYRILAGVTVPHFRNALLQVIEDLNREGLAKAIVVQPLNDLWPCAVKLYANSGGYRLSEENFRDLIAPFDGQLNSQQFDQLLDAICETGQNWAASETPSLLLRLLRNAPPTSQPTHDARNRFFQYVIRGQHSRNYPEVLTLFKADGWVPPPEAEDDANVS